MFGVVEEVFEVDVAVLHYRNREWYVCRPYHTAVTVQLDETIAVLYYVSSF